MRHWLVQASRDTPMTMNSSRSIGRAANACRSPSGFFGASEGLIYKKGPHRFGRLSPARACEGLCELLGSQKGRL